APPSTPRASESFAYTPPAATRVRRLEESRTDAMDANTNSDPSNAGAPGQLLDWLRPHAAACLGVLALVLVQVAYYLSVPFAFKVLFDDVLPRGDLAGLARVQIG